FESNDSPPSSLMCVNSDSSCSNNTRPASFLSCSFCALESICTDEMIRVLNSETCRASIMAGIAASTTFLSVFATSEKPDTPINADNMTSIAIAMNDNRSLRPMLAVASNIFS
ncbi:hypothetical protein D043_2050B, partial [Vibrio parahaemolyticus EKP-021]